MTSDSDTPPFTQAWRGNLRGILKWPDLDRLWQAVTDTGTDCWYIWQLTEPVPTRPATASQLTAFLSEITTLLKQDHEHDYCGIVYADNREHPRLVKIYDPNNLGVSCGFSDNPPPPGWVLSVHRPQPLASLQVRPENRRRWWRRLFQ